MNWDLQAYGYSQTRIIENLRVFVVYAVLHSFITMLYELSLTQQKFCNPQACVKVIFNFVDVFPSTFLQPVNCSKNSIYTELSYETWSLHVFQTIEIFSILFSYSLSDYLLLQSSVRNALWRPKLKKNHNWDCELRNKQTVKKLNLWDKMAVNKIACIKACFGMKNYTCLIGSFFAT